MSDVTARISVAAALVLLLLGPSLEAQPREAPQFLGAVLRQLLDYRTATGARLTKEGGLVSVDLAGLDTALGALGVSGRYEPAALERDVPGVRLSAYREVGTCRTTPRGERCTLPRGVVLVRFFSPRRIGADNVAFMLGTYERGHGSDADPGTVGVVYEVVARRDGANWRFVTVTRRYVG